MYEVKMKNWGPFHTYIQEEWERYNKLRQDSKDPYKQIVLDEKKKTLETIAKEYRNYLKTIDDDHGVKFLLTLDNYYNSVNNKLKLENESYMQQVYQGVSILVKDIIFKFNDFRIEE